MEIINYRHVRITFAHVTGFGKVKQELQEVVTFLEEAQEGGQSESKAMKLALLTQTLQKKEVWFL